MEKFKAVGNVIVVCVLLAQSMRSNGMLRLLKKAVTLDWKTSGRDFLPKDGSPIENTNKGNWRRGSLDFYKGAADHPLCLYLDEKVGEGLAVEKFKEDLEKNRNIKKLFFTSSERKAQSLDFQIREDLKQQIEKAKKDHEETGSMSDFFEAKQLREFCDNRYPTIKKAAQDFRAAVQHVREKQENCFGPGSFIRIKENSFGLPSMDRDGKNQRYFYINYGKLSDGLESGVSFAFDMNNFDLLPLKNYENDVPSLNLFKKVLSEVPRFLPLVNFACTKELRLLKEEEEDELRENFPKVIFQEEKDVEKIRRLEVCTQEGWGKNNMSEASAIGKPFDFTQNRLPDQISIMNDAFYEQL